jgi:tetratricopeptide (TPR) repeat protein
MHLHRLMCVIAAASSIVCSTVALAEAPADPKAAAKAEARRRFEESCRQAEQERIEKAKVLEGRARAAGNSEQAAGLKHELARTCESIRGRGEDARQTYQDILKNHKDYSRYHEVAFRLGELHSSVLLPGTVIDYDKAVAFYEDALAHCPPDVFIRPQAHLSLGLLYWRMKDRDKALINLEEAYRFDSSALKCDTPVDTPEQEQRRLEMLKADVEMIRDHAARFIIVVQEDPLDPAKTLITLDELEKKHAGDPKLADVIGKERERMLAKGQRMLPQLESLMTFPGGRKAMEVVPAK